ncbi:hypothetical protein Pla175_21420 [Pirellulimonas nuda]|uniref:PEP-CTERM protein-sorting domain-containing protein n=2 Tax=Pirellulimonas nuda TaxID=2528009 RepID=A0A518DBA9_9BACT|nr:hypothetical protein Pla175_21420 [Pirellulimonas nuda]
MFRVGVTDITDVNLDGVTNALDKAIVMANLGAMADLDGLNGPTFFEGEINNDLLVNELDLAFFGTPGDYNDDGAVNAADYTVWRDNLGAANEDALNGNGSGSGGVDAADYTLWKNEFGNGASGALQAASVPEPGAALLSVLAFAALAGGRARSLAGRRG